MRMTLPGGVSCVEGPERRELLGSLALGRGLGAMPMERQRGGRCPLGVWLGVWYPWASVLSFEEHGFRKFVLVEELGEA